MNLFVLWEHQVLEKTTLLNNLSTIDTPTKGEVYINGKNVNHMSESDLCKFRTNVLGFIFQNYNVIDTLTIYETYAYHYS